MKLLGRVLVVGAMVFFVLLVGRTIYLAASADTVSRYGHIVEYPMCNESWCRVRVEWRSGELTTEDMRSHILPMIGDSIKETCPIGEAREWLGCSLDTID